MKALKGEKKIKTSVGLYEHGANQYIVNVSSTGVIKRLLEDIESQYETASNDSDFAFTHNLAEEYDGIRKSIIKLAKLKKAINEFTA